MWEIIIGIIGIGLIIFGYFIDDIKKYFKKRSRRKKGLCIRCKTNRGTSNWSIYGLTEEYIRCDNCGKVQRKVIKNT